MGKHSLRLLKFALDYPGWHSCADDSRRTMYRLEAQGLLEVIRYSGKRVLPQFRIRQPK